MSSCTQNFLTIDCRNSVILVNNLEETLGNSPDGLSRKWQWPDCGLQ